MAEPRIQYARTTDGVNIAFSTLGEGGTPVVGMPLHLWSHIGEWWQFPEVRGWVERLAQNRMIVGYDGRGSGLSDRDVLDHSLDSLQLDLQAVVDRLRLETFALQGVNSTGPVAISYAARHPQRVSHLLLVNTWARSEDAWLSSQYQAFSALRDLDWNTYTETVARAGFGWSDDVLGSRTAAFLRKCVTQEVAHAAYAAIQGFDVTDLLSEVTAPALVLHRRESTVDVSLARELASRIPDARLALLEGSEGPLALGDTDAAFLAINEFLGEGEEAEEKVDLPTGTAIILFADIADSTALTEQIGDSAFREKARDLDGSLRTIIREHNGTPIEGKLLGDGVLATFTSASQAIEAALQCGAAGGECGLALHLGIHAGDVIREENNVYGGAVNIAARMAIASAPGEVLVSQTVRDLARTSAGVSFEERGERELKGVGEPVRVYEVRSRE